MSTINEVIKRINELAAKKKSGRSLTPEELEEKKSLYNTYLGFIRGQVIDTLDRVEFVDPETGARTKPNGVTRDTTPNTDNPVH